jgi:hypothetical protein
METFTINAGDVKSSKKIGKNRKVIPVRSIQVQFDPNLDGITVMSQYAYDEFLKTGTVKSTDANFDKKAPAGTILHMIQTEHQKNNQ